MSGASDQPRMHGRATRRFFLGAVLSLFVSSCSSLPEVSEAAFAKSGVEVPAGLSMEGLALGRKLYVDKCSGCHFLHAPSEFDKAHWSEKIFPKMAREAKLSAGESEPILNYLLLFSKSSNSRR